MLWLARTGLFRLPFALFALWGSLGLASAADWKVEKAESGSFIFRSGNWVSLKTGDQFSRDALLMTDATGGMVLSGTGSRLTLGHQTRAQFFARDSENLTNIYQYAGTLGASIDATGPEMQVETPFAIVKAQVGGFATQTGAESSLVVVTTGVVGVIDLERNAQVDVNAGKSLRAARGRPITDSPMPAAPFTIDTLEGLSALAGLPDRASSESSLADSIDSYNAGSANLEEAIAYVESLPWQEKLAGALGITGVSLLAGLALDYFLGAGVGMIGNSLVVLAGLAAGAFIRLRFLVDLSWRNSDPGISLGLMLGMATLFLIVATLARGSRQV